MTETDEHLNRFEDPEDMLEYVYEKVQDAVYFWCLWSKTFLHDYEGDGSKEMLNLFIEAEFDDVFDRLLPLIEKRKDGNVITGLILDRRRDSDKRKQL